MLLTTIFFPLSLVYVGGFPTCVLVLLAFSPALAMYIIGDTSSVTFNSIDYTVISVSTILVGLYVLLLGVCTWYLQLESYFDSTPWLVKNSTFKEKEDLWKCPFTGINISFKYPQKSKRAPYVGCCFTGLDISNTLDLQLLQAYAQPDDAQVVKPGYTRMPF